MPIQFDDPSIDPLQPQRQAPEASFGDTVADVALSPLRGAEQFLRGVAGLGNIIPGVEYDTSGATFGEAKSTVGKFATGVFEFAAGFVPAAGIVGRLGKVAQASRFSGVAKAASVLQKSNVARGLAVGGVQDFVSYGGQEERLSNLVQEFPGLANPITDYLAADEDDSELEGRFKNVLEGAGLGAATDLLFMGIKAVRAGRKAKVRGDDVEKAFQESFDDAEADEALAAFGRRLDGDPAQAGEDAVQAARRQDPDLSPLDEGAIRSAAERDAAELRGDLEAPADPAEVFGVEDVQTFRDALEIRAAQSGEELAEQFEKGGVNIAASVQDQGIARVIRAAEDMVGPLPPGKADTITTAEQLEQAAERMGDIMGTDGSMQTLIAAARQGEADITRVNRQLLAQEAVVLRMSQDLLNGRNIDEIADDELGDILAPFAELHQYNRGIRSEQGRGLQSARTGSARILESLGDVRFANDPKAQRKLLQKMQDGLGEGGIEGAAAAMRTLQDAVAGPGKFIGVVNELFINNVLGSAKSLTINALTPTALSVLTPAQNILGGALTGNRAVMREGLREIMTLSETVRESFALARKSFKTGQGQLLPSQSIRDDPGRFTDAITAENFNLDGSAVGGVVDFLGKAIRIPTRFLGATDEFVKQMNYRAVSKGRLWDQGLQQGLEGADLVTFVEDGMRSLVLEGQAASSDAWLQRGLQEAAKLGKQGDEAVAFAEQFASENFSESLSDIAQAGVQRAEEVTFTAPLAKGSLGQKVQDISNTVPLAKLVLPFVKTPVNIAGNAAQRVDIIGVTETLIKTRAFTREAPGLAESAFRFSRDMASGDPRRKAEAIGRVSTGFALATSFGVMASQGQITGRGPSDPEQRRLLLEAGWQPYSVKTGDGYVSYSRLDPFATIIGTVADFFDYGRYSDDTDQELMSTALPAAAMALANNVTNKTYLQGLGDFIGAVSEPDRKLVPFLERQLSSIAVPGSVAQLTGLDDPHMRELNSLSERIRSRIPGYADNLAPLRNVLGEPIRRQQAQFSDAPGAALWDIMSPIAYRESTDDVITRELANLRHGFSPPKKTLAGQDLLEFRSASGQTAYDRWTELHGKVKVGGRTLRQELKRLFRDRQYQQMADVGDGTGPSPRVQAVRSVINRFRGVARDQMEREYPELRQALREQERSRLALRRSGVSRDPDLFSL